ncbi:MAG: ATP-dependent Clp protease adaptor ClpS [Desulfomonilaceae bacterium]|nr:ATP-dependent Clp protease adaptor ClpS [Desulfomonilaceae bacterium]
MPAGEPRGSRKERKSYGIRRAREHDCHSGVFFYTSRRFPPVVVRPDDPQDDAGDESELYEVRIIDNDYNTYQEVMDITMLALGIDPAQAFSVAWEVDHRGHCVVAHAPREQAEELANVIRSIGIEVQVNPVSKRSH